MDGRPYWTGIQLDEVAFPVVLAWRLWKLGLVEDFDAYPMVRGCVSYLIRRGPASPQERWEEDAGLSPSTLAAEISALVCAAEMARARGDAQTEQLCLSIADCWASHLEQWTFTNRGTLVEGCPEHYVRLESLDPETLESDHDPNTGYIHINNLPAENSGFPIYDIIDGGFLELVRYGLRAPDNPHVLKSLVVNDAVLKVETPCGPCWRRYNHDGYGQKANGEAFDGTGVGRAWPLLTGERAHYEIAAGRDVEDTSKPWSALPTRAL